MRTLEGGFLFGRASDVGGNIEGIHDQSGSAAGLLIDAAKTIRAEILDTLDRDVPAFHEFHRTRQRRVLSDNDSAKPASKFTLPRSD